MGKIQEKRRGRALRAAAVLAALALLGASPAPEGRERISRGEVLARVPGRLVEQGEDRLCFEDGKGCYTLYFFDGQGRLCRLARLEPGESAAPAQKEAYRRFSQGFYRWALEPEGRRQLIAAVYLYVYLHRDTGAQ